MEGGLSLWDPLLISQIVANVGLAVILKGMGGTMDDFNSHTIFLTGITALLTMIPCLYFYKRDVRARVTGGLIPKAGGRRLKAGEGLWLLLIGASLATFANMLVAALQNILPVREYQETMNQITSGKSIWMLVFWMGIVAPVAEEMVFRWLIYFRLRDYMRMGMAMAVSGILFGIYHMNLTQAVYASILGMMFAYFLENDRKSVGKRPASYRRQLLVCSYAGNSFKDSKRSVCSRSFGNRSNTFCRTFDRNLLF